MITYNSNKFNNLIKKISKILISNNINIKDSQEIIPTSILDDIKNYVISRLEPTNKFLSLPCPKCNKCHLEPMQSTYERKVIFKIENTLIKININVPRVKCSNCGSTHSILPSFCVPFKRYSKQAILEIASEASITSTQNVADTLDIDSKQVRRFLNIVNSYKNDIILLSYSYPRKFNNISNNLELYNIISTLPKEIDEIYFKEFGKVFLYIKNARKIYMRYKKLSP